MAGWSLAIELAVVLCGTAALAHAYGDWRRHRLAVTACVLVAWYFSFIIVFVLPLDVSLTFYGKCLHEDRRSLLAISTEKPLAARSDVSVAPDHNSSTPALPELNKTMIAKSAEACQTPSNYVKEEVLVDLWSVVYWTAQVLTWLVLPVMQSYANAGEFTFGGRLRTALYENAIYYGIMLLVFGVLLIYLAVHKVSLDGESLKVVLVTASNTWGLCLLVALLGYGLVEVPRHVWLAADIGYRLNKTYFDIEKLSSDKNDAEESVRETFADTQDILACLPFTHPFRPWAETIMQRFPMELAERLQARARGGHQGTAGSRGSLRDADAANVAATSEAFLVRLHRRVIVSLAAHQRTQTQWAGLVKRAIHLEDVQANLNARNRRRFVRSAAAHAIRQNVEADDGPVAGALRAALCSPALEWYWECVLKRPCLRLVALLAAAGSLLLVWSECTFFVVSPTLSLAAVMVYSAAANYSYGYIELSSLLVIGYLCVCAYFTIFRLRIYRYYQLHSNHHTDEGSLLFSAMLVCRLTPPLCLNFLGMIHLDSHVTSDANFGVETAFTKLMGHLDLISVVSNGINVYLPMAIVLLCCATYFRLGQRCLRSVGVDQFIDDEDYDDIAMEMVNAGKALVQMERNRHQRRAARGDASDKLRATTGGRLGQDIYSKHKYQAVRTQQGKDNPAAELAEWSGRARAASSDSNGEPDPFTSTAAASYQDRRGAGARRDFGPPASAPINQQGGIFDDL